MPVDEMRFHLTPVSANVKTGPIPVSTTSSNSCPVSCPLKNAGCYAGIGNLAYHWKAVSHKGRGGDWQEFLDKVKRLPAGQLWRHNQAGDLPGDGVTLDAKAVQQLAVANGKSAGFTYTHYPMSVRKNRDVVRAANKTRFTVNASFENAADAVRCLTRYKIPAVTIVAHDAPKVQRVKGTRVVMCPAYYQESLTCARCQLCHRADRNYVIAFPAHGTAWRKVEKLIGVRQ
jgi:hypothetical protein